MAELLPPTEGVVIKSTPYRPSPECLRRLEELDRDRVRSWAYMLAHPDQFIVD